jgi:ribosomal-protein-alanine N-acetyltransferase
MGGMGTPGSTLRTERLHLRPYTPADLATVVDRLILDPEVIRFWHAYLAPGIDDDDRRRMALTDFGEWFDAAITAGLPVWVLEPADAGVGPEGAFIGVAGILPPEHDEGPEPELGYLLVSAFHGRGLATEAVGAIVDDAFRRLDLPRLCAVVDVPNVASIRVLEKLGFALDREYVGGDGHPYRRYVRDRPD